MSDKMTLPEIHAMLQVGTNWRIESDYGKQNRPPLDQVRTIVKKQTREFVSLPLVADGKPRWWHRIPKASEVIAAHDGFLHYKLVEFDVETKMTRQESADAAINQGC